jgi:uncharacterized membrane protein YkvA (DUF1232 family)
MSTLETVLAGVLILLLIAILSAMFAWWFIGRRGRVLTSRVGALPMRQKAQLAGSLFGDPQLPLYTRVILALLVGYTALPIDLIPDFIPVLGQIDDIVMLSLGTAILVRSMPKDIFDEHLARLEEEAAKEASSANQAS